jgi:hypothetical protein
MGRFDFGFGGLRDTVHVRGFDRNDPARGIRTRYAMEPQPTTNDAPHDARHDDAKPAWWNPWRWPTGIWALVIGLCLLLLPFGIRAVMLSGVPAMEEPFDVDEFVRWDVPADDDACTEYRKAAELFSRIRPQNQAVISTEQLDAVWAKGWIEADDPVMQWMDRHREALTVWRRGTEKDRCLCVSPGALDFFTEIPTIENQRWFVRLARSESVRCIHEGRLDEAWQWLRAALRSGGHVTHRGCLIQGLQGVSIHSTSAAGMSYWAEQPDVTADQLKRALAELKSDQAIYESESNILKAEYLAARNTLMQSKWAEVLGNGSADESAGVRVATKMGLWVVGEPELALRLFRQILANQIREVDKPLASRRKLAGAGIVLLFDPDPSVPMLPGQLGPTAIDRVINRSIVARQLLPAMKRFDSVLRRQPARQAAIEITLAAQAYRRELGEFPDSLQRLVPAYLPSIPTDPCDPSGGPVLYRRDDPLHAVVWSVGDDGVDGGGDVDESKRRSSDVGFTLK